MSVACPERWYSSDPTAGFQTDVQAGFELGGVEALQTKFLMQPSDYSLDIPEEVQCSQVTNRRQGKLREELQIKVESKTKLAWRKSYS